MELFESYTHSFVIKIWLEEMATDKNGAVWRGHITHIPSGKRHYISTLNDIAIFVSLYLDEMGVKPGDAWRIKQWLKW